MEMLRTERGGQEQIAGELEAYNPLIPQGSDLVATIMFEINNKVRRLEVLSSIGDVDRHFYIKIGEQRISGVNLLPEDAHTKKGEKASAVHFIRFPLSAHQKQTLLGPGPHEVRLGVSHENYCHETKLSDVQLKSLKEDLVV
jgi:hypothetical protein